LADLKISELQALAGANLAATDELAVADISASETKKITVNDLIAYGADLISSAEIPSAKISFAAGSIVEASLATGAVTATKIDADAVTAAKLGDQSTCIVAASKAALDAVIGDFVGQLGFTTDAIKIYLWQNSTWNSVKAAGSINTITASTSGIVNITASTSGDTVTVGTTLDNTAAAAEFLAGPTGSSGAVGYRAIVGTDLPVPTTTTKGAVAINAEGLRMDGDRLEINNDVALSATHHVVTYDAKGLITGGRTLLAADLPVATSGAVGGVTPGTGLSVTGAGALNHTNSATPGTHTKITFDAQGHVTSGTALADTDLPNHSAALLTTGTLDIARIASSAITGAKLANYAVSKFGETQPTADHIGQFFFNPLTRELYLWDGNVYQPVGISAGEIVLAGTYNANTNQLDSVTADGTAAGFTSGQALPAAAAVNNRYYVVVSTAGTGTSPAPAVALAPPDLLLSNGSSYIKLDVSDTITAVVALNVGFTPYGNIAASNVQSAIQELDDEKLPLAGGTITGELLIGTSGSFAFEGASANAYETYLTAADPTADRTITLPDQSGNVIVSGNASIVNADINASAAIAFSKLASLTSANILVGNGSNVATSVAMSGDVTIDSSGATTVISGTTSVAGKLQLTDSTSSTSTTTAATPNAVKTAYDLANAALPKSGGTITGNLEIGTAGSLTFEGSTADAFETTLAVTDPTADRTITLPDASLTVAGINLAQSFSAAQRGTISALTDGATITADFAVANNFSVTLGGNRTLANPSNLTAGQSGCIWITQDGTGSRTLAYGSQWDFTGGTAPTLTTTAAAVDCLVYAVQSSTKITATLITNLS
jgi:hypothetical protein